MAFQEKTLGLPVTFVGPDGARVGAGGLVTGQVSVLTSETEIVPARAGRRSVVITSFGTDTIYVGPSPLTTADGDMIPPIAGAKFTIDTEAAVFGIATSMTTVVSFMEIS